MDRRGFIRDTGGVMLWGASWPLAHALAKRTVASPQSMLPQRDFAAEYVAVFDPSLAPGRQLALEAAQRGFRAFALEADADIGALWHTAIAPCIAHRPALAVALRPADAFVLARLASAFDCALTVI
jgi:hypothetical protein